MLITSGRELIKKAMHLEQNDRTPWVPFVGVHGGKLLGVDATTYLKSGDHIFNGVTKAIEIYDPDGIPVLFDLQVEAEVLGCDLMWANDNPPSVASHPLNEGKKLEELKIPTLEDGRIGMIMETTRRLREAHPDTALYGLITGPFTLALHLLGTDVFIKMLEEEEYVHRVMEFGKQVSMFMAEEYIKNGCDVIALVDPMTSQISPEQFRQFVTGPATEIFDFIREKGALSSFFVCGYAQQNIEAMCECRPDNVSIDENIPLDYVREVALPMGVSFGGNMKLTVVLLMGTPEECQVHALECMDQAGEKGFILAPGCDLPMDTPPENLKAVTQLVHDDYQREVIRTLMENQPEEEKLPDMSEYGQTDKVIVDIITLASESCAPCKYMVDAVKNVAPEFEGILEWREHSIKKMEAVNFMNALMVRSLPTICIDGKIAFTSKIPPRSELIQAIQNRINEKLKLKLSQKRPEMLLFTTDKEEEEKLHEVVSEAISELGADVDIRHITDQKIIRSYGVHKTPAVMTVSYKMKSQGRLPSVDVVREWVKEVM
ncbi:MAG: thioredoxin family protein [Bacteroidales bacterium]|nr:thioredoxin family protein [Bacteroidales bacterium]